MNLHKISLFLIIGFLLVFSSVSALQVSSQSSVSPLCPRETGLFTDVVVNDGNTVQEYSVSLRGSASSWATSVPTGFILNPGEERTLFTYVTPSQSAEPGNYNLEIALTSSTDSKNIMHNVGVKTCYGVSLNTVASSLSSCPGEPVRYSVRVVNNGEYRTTFRLELSGSLANRITLSDNIATLGKGESKDILLFVNAPPESGEHSFTLIATSEDGRIRQSLPMFLVVNPCYDFTLTIRGNNTYSMCDRSSVVVPLNLENRGTTLNSYRLELEGPVWARLEKSDFVLKDKEARSFNLVFAPGYGAAGEYGIRLSVIPERGFVKAVSDFSVSVRKCNSVDVQFLVDDSDACKNSNNQFTALVTNDGEKRHVYRLELSAPSWVSLSDSQLFTLDPGQNKNVTISAVPVSDVEEDSYEIRLRATTTDDSSVVANDEAVLTLDVKDAEDCYRSSFNTQYDDVVVYYDSSVAIPIDVRNDGFRRAEYSLFLSGNAATFSTLSPSVLTLDPGKSETVYLYAAPNVNTQLGNYDASVALNVKNGPLLTSKLFNIEVTDVRERATQFDLTPAETSDSANETNDGVSVWFRLKSWFKGLFTKPQTNFTNETSVVADSNLNLTSGFVYPPAENTENEVFESDVANTTSGSFSAYKWYLLAALIVIVVVVVLHLFLAKTKGKKKSSKKKKLSKESESIKEEVGE